MFTINARRVKNQDGLEGKFCDWCGERFQFNDFMLLLDENNLHKACGYAVLERIHQALVVNI